MVNSVWNWANGLVNRVFEAMGAGTINDVALIKDVEQFDGGNVMRAAISLLAVFLFFSISASAQGPAGAGSNSRYSSLGEHQNDPWQIAVGYQYNRNNLLGSPFNTHGLNVSATRFFGRWFGVEAQMGTGFLGNTGQTSNPPNLDAKSIFIGGGPRLALRSGSRYEPWAHVVVGMEHYRFSQTAGVLGSNNALAGVAGGGLDVYLTPHWALRAEADAVGSRFFSTNQRSFQIVAGFVFSF
jgi:hypothetical protein